jgi:hypothetical protein
VAILDTPLTLVFRMRTEHSGYRAAVLQTP